MPVWGFCSLKGTFSGWVFHFFVLASFFLGLEVGRGVAQCRRKGTNPSHPPPEKLGCKDAAFANFMHDGKKDAGGFDSPHINRCEPARKKLVGKKKALSQKQDLKPQLGKTKGSGLRYVYDGN